MHACHDILVAIDLSADAETASAAPEPPARPAVQTARFLARQTAATLTFFSVLDDAAATDRALAVLADLAKRAQQDGLQAQAKVAVGNGPAEILRQVERHGHDLAVFGAPSMKGLKYALLGSTATKVLRQSPCPVWLALPRARAEPRNLLIASDLTPTSVNALRLGTRLALDLGVRAHVLHVVDYPLDHHWSTGDRDAQTAEYHRQFRAEALAALRQQLEGAADPEAVGTAQLHVVGRTGVTDREVLAFLQAHEIDLLVVGQTARVGIGEMLLGNTAERLLPQVSCPLLVVRE
jgi:nucleotide-binding universal stress UspA family protein